MIGRFKIHLLSNIHAHICPRVENLKLFIIDYELHFPLIWFFSRHMLWCMISCLSQVQDRTFSYAAVQNLSIVTFQTNVHYVIKAYRCMKDEWVKYRLFSVWQTCSGEPMTPEEMARKDRERQEKKLRLGFYKLKISDYYNLTFFV